MTRPEWLAKREATQKKNEYEFVKREEERETRFSQKNPIKEEKKAKTERPVKMSEKKKERLENERLENERLEKERLGSLEERLAFAKKPVNLLSTKKTVKPIEPFIAEENKNEVIQEQHGEPVEKKANPLEVKNIKFELQEQPEIPAPNLSSLSLKADLKKHELEEYPPLTKFATVNKKTLTVDTSAVTEKPVGERSPNENSPGNREEGANSLAARQAMFGGAKGAKTNAVTSNTAEAIKPKAASAALDKLRNKQTLQSDATQNPPKKESKWGIPGERKPSAIQPKATVISEASKDPSIGDNTPPKKLSVKERAALFNR